MVGGGWLVVCETSLQERGSFFLVSECTKSIPEASEVQMPFQDLYTVFRKSSSCYKIFRSISSATI